MQAARIVAGLATAAIVSGGVLFASEPAYALPRECSYYRESYNSAAYWSNYYWNAAFQDVINGQDPTDDYNAYDYNETWRVFYAQSIMELQC